MPVNNAHLLTISLRTKVLKPSIAALSLLLTVGLPAWSADECEYGPPNLIKITPNPFNARAGSEEEGAALGETDSELGSISLSSPPKSIAQKQSGSSSPVQRLSLKERLIASRLFMPERMLLGTPAKFTVKGKPGMMVAIAMADKDKGAKPIGGHQLRLGPDRKVVAISKLNESGVAEIYVETPIEGDLIGQFLYFEAALWSKPDMSDCELADTVSSAVAATPVNAVMVAQAADTKIKGVNIVPDSAMPMMMRQNEPSLGSGRP
jgi:hypothetical protein